MKIEQTRVILREELDDLKQRIIANHIAAGQKASGSTIASLRVVANDKDGVLYGRQAFGVLEAGRAPGKVPMNFTQIICQWIIDKGLSVTPIPYIRQPSEKWMPKYTPEERGLMSLAGAIAYNIKTKGSGQYRSGNRSDIYSSEIPKAVDNILRRVSRMFEVEIETINQDSNENNESR